MRKWTSSKRRWLRGGFQFALGPTALLLLLAAPAPVPAREAASAPVAASPVMPAAPLPASAPAGEPDVGFPIRGELRIGRLGAGEYAWNDEGVPAGRPVIVVNLKARLLSVYRSGFEIGRSNIVYGADEKPTPHGIFPILEKDADHVSRTYAGAPMPYMLRLTGDGIAIHGSEIADDIVTHGCVGLPKAFARLLFAAVQVGDRVIIWQG
jgi:L,D-transpeptidase-like protein